MMKSSAEVFSKWNLVIIGALIAGLWFVQPYVSVIALSLVIAYLFNPMYTWLQKRMSGGLAMTTTVFAALFAGLIPVTLIFIIAFGQLTNLVDAVQDGAAVIEGQSLNDVVTSVSDEVNEVASNLFGVNEAISNADVTNFVTSAIPTVLNAGLDILTGLVGGIPSFFTTVIIFLFLFTGALSHRKSLMKYAYAISPFDKKANDEYFRKIGAMTKGMLKGQLIIATCQGILGAASLLFIGLGDYFLFFAVLFSFLNLIPLGSGLVTIPLGILALFTGNFWQGLLILLNHFLVVTNIDNILRPKLVPKDAYLPPALIILATFCGVAYFGLLGVVYGPIIMIVLTTTFEMYEKYQKGS